MKKTKIQNIMLYIINFILIVVILLSNKGFILNNDKIILKEMSESTQVSDLNKSITELEASHEEYQNYIQTSKQKITNAINMYPNNNATENNSLEEFSIMITNLTNVPENTYFYQSGTEGDSSTIVRYKKVDEKYYICDSNGIVAEGTADTDISSLTLIPYNATVAKNLSAGSASYASSKLYLGDGSDNAAYSKLTSGVFFEKIGDFNLNANTSKTITSSNLSKITGIVCYAGWQSYYTIFSMKEITYYNGSVGSGVNIYPGISNAFSFSYVNDTTVKINNVHSSVVGKFSNFYLIGEL